MEAAKTAESSQIFQCKINMSHLDGTKEIRTIILSKADLRFLKAVQDSTKDYIEFLFAKRKKELIKEAEEASRESKIPNGVNGWTIKTLQAEDLNRIDKYHQYVSRYDYPNNIEP